MKFALKIRLFPTQEQQKILLRTIQLFNKVCNYISKRAFENKIFNQVKLHYFVYKEVRGKFDIPAQFVVRAIAKVANCYKNNKKNFCKFERYSVVVCDRRLLSFVNLSVASLNTVAGRQKIPFVFCDYASINNNRMIGEADLIYKDNNFFLYLVVEVPDSYVKERIESIK